MDCLPNEPGALLRAAAAACFALAFAASAAETTPQIFKCTDASGNVTYQNEPCPKSAKAGRIEIFDNRWSATKEEREAEWRRSASEHRLVAGMPGRFVREALGEPTEVRDTQKAGAAQLWLYNLTDRSVEVGMLNDQVLWFQETPTATPARSAQAPETAASPARAAAAPEGPIAPPRVGPPNHSVAAPPTAAPPTAAAPPAAAPPAAAPDRTAAAAPALAQAGLPSAPPTEAKPAANRAVARGQDCRQVLSALGAPTRQREVPALDAGSDPAIEYFYESDAGRLRIVCANGKVEGVDRSVAR
ncbi:MAG TPA: DUF4124 domain-containing protein [Casimicrobiaceae bacterium]|nr:DUF4124 domain-containing protein [Casimicrobiaceae bacterium]